MSSITPHKLGVHKILKHIPLNAIFDAPSKRRLAKAVNIADLRLCAKARAHKVSSSSYCYLCVVGRGRLLSKLRMACINEKLNICLLRWSC